MKILMIIHFPGSKDGANEESESEKFSVPSINLRDLVVSMINEEKSLSL